MPVSLNVSGTADWTNNSDTWREEDAEWLQARSVVRFAAEADAATATPSHTADGSVAYISGTDQRFIGRVAGGWRRFLTSQHLSYAETSGLLTLKHGSATTGLTLSSGSAAGVAGALTVGGATTLSSDTSLTGELTISNGTYSGTLKANASANKIESTVEVLAPSLRSSGSVTTVGLTSTGTASLTNAAVSGTLDVTGTLTASVVGVSTLSAATSVTGGSLRLSGTSLTHTTASSPTVGIGAGATGNLTLTAASGRVRVSDGTNAAPVASYVISASAPSSTAYPEGTIWLQI